MAKKYGKWKTQGNLSEGGQGHIYLVKNTEKTDSKEYVLKRLKNKEKRVNKFKKEIKAGLKLKHQYIVKIEDYDINHEKPYLITDYYSKGDLSKFNWSSYSLVDKLKFFKKICEAIKYAHEQGVIHRDIKPSNIFIKDNFEPVVGDFGLCYIEDSERDTNTDEAIGSRYYMAPELADGKLDEINLLSDIYSLGKLLYFILTGKIFDREKHNTPKFNITNYKNILKPKHETTLTLINDIFNDTIAENPKDRLKNVNTLIDKIDEICLLEKISPKTLNSIKNVTKHQKNGKYTIDIINTKKLLDNIHETFLEIESKCYKGYTNNIPVISNTMLKGLDHSIDDFSKTPLKGDIFELIDLCEKANNNIKEYNLKHSSSKLIHIGHLKDKFFILESKMRKDLEDLDFYDEVKIGLANQENTSDISNNDVNKFNKISNLILHQIQEIQRQKKYYSKKLEDFKNNVPINSLEYWNDTYFDELKKELDTTNLSYLSVDIIGFKKKFDTYNEQIKDINSIIKYDTEGLDLILNNMVFNLSLTLKELSAIGDIIRKNFKS